MTTTNKQTVQIVVDLCAQKGVKRVVVSPGSRNAPLSIAFNRDPRVECFVIVDERSAAFFALGLSQRSGEAVALVCTSGTALLNYAPAVAEAFYQRIPLIILSADRPIEWIEQDDSQAINQQQVFSNFTKYNCQIPAEINCDDEAWHVNRVINEAINYASSGRKGPVHINIPLREPLYGISEKANILQRTIDQFESDAHLSTDTLRILKSRLPESPKIMVLASFLPNEGKEKMNKIIASIENLPNVIVLAEPISNIVTSHSISTIDRVLNTIKADEILDLTPDVLISFGGSLVSKQIKTFIKNNPPKEHWYIGKGETHVDTFRRLTALIQIDPVCFLDLFFLENHFLPNDYASLWNEKLQIATERHNAFMKNAPWSDLKAFEIISQAIPEESDLQLGNSSAVRYGHLFPQKNLNCIQSNRGTSGIDGSTSTAVGAAWISDKTTTLISGDISFFYDSNALWNKYLSPNLRIFVMKNGGGSLFRFIPGPSEVEELDEYFEAAQELDIENISKLYSLPFYRARNEEELKSCMYKIFEPHDKPVIIEVCTPRFENDKVLKSYFKAIRN